MRIAKWLLSSLIGLGILGLIAADVVPLITAKTSHNKSSGKNLTHAEQYLGSLPYYLLYRGLYAILDVTSAVLLGFCFYWYKVGSRETSKTFRYTLSPHLMILAASLATIELVSLIINAIYTTYHLKMHDEDINTVWPLLMVVS